MLRILKTYWWPNPGHRFYLEAFRQHYPRCLNAVTSVQAGMLANLDIFLMVLGDSTNLSPSLSRKCHL